MEAPWPGAAGPLGTYANNSSSLGDRQAEKAAEQAKRWQAKRDRYDLRAALWDVTTLGRARKCGRVAVSEGGGVGLRITEGADGRVAGLSGVATCGSVWVCPVCAAKVARERADELGRLLAWAVEEGHTVAMVTLTVRHHQGHELKDLLDGVYSAWGAVTSGGAWVGESQSAYARRVERWETGPRGLMAGRPRPERREGIRDRWEVLGWARVLEATLGEHGWHPHVHAIMILDGEQPPEVCRRLGEAIWPHWERALNRRGLTALRDSGGLDVRCSTDEGAEGLAAYLVKSLAVEATHGHAKTGRKNSRNPFEVLRTLLATGDADDLDRWHEWERATRGRRQIGWSKGMRDLAGLAAERSDEEIAADEGDGSDVLVMPAETWAQVRHEQGALLVAAERFGVPGARAWLRARRMAWYDVPAPQPRRPRDDDGGDPPHHE